MDAQNVAAGPAVFVFGPTDGGGIAFVNGRLVRVPPRVDRAVAELRTAAHMLATADALGDVDLKQTLTRLAVRLAESAGKEVLEAVK